MGHARLRDSFMSPNSAPEPGSHFWRCGRAQRLATSTSFFRTTAAIFHCPRKQVKSNQIRLQTQPQSVYVGQVCPHRANAPSTRKNTYHKGEFATVSGETQPVFSLGLARAPGGAGAGIRVADGSPLLPAATSRTRSFWASPGCPAEQNKDGAYRSMCFSFSIGWARRS